MKTFRKLACGLAFTAVACTQVKAQEAEVPVAAVQYLFTHVNDTNNKDKPYWEKMILYIGKDHSLYKSFGSIALRQENAKQAKVPGFKSLVYTDSIVYMMKHKTHDVLYYTPKEKKLVRTSRILATDYLFDETYPVINWKIGKDKKMVGKYSCQSAVGTYAGREYTAWFCKDLPYQLGPWKLQGLPGLILEAADSKGEVKFQFTDFSYQTPEPDEFIVLSDIAERKTPQELAKIREMIAKDPNAAYNAAIDKANADVAAGKRANAKELNIVMPMAEKPITTEGQTGGGKGTAGSNNPLELRVK